MRINLLTPFAEKDAVKALGARWDAAKKCWFITDVADLTPFARWIPNVESVATTKPANKTQSPVVSKQTNAATTATNDKADCGCDVLPWEDCIHTTKP